MSMCTRPNRVPKKILPMAKLEVILSPMMLDSYELAGKSVVVFDIVRATTIICAALAHGAQHVLPLPSKEDVLLKRAEGYMAVGEHDGIVLDGFDINNSPLHFVGGAYRGRKVALSTTNGTETLLRATAAQNLYVGGFLNADALAEMLVTQGLDVVLLCAGWKGRVCMEDSLCAGYVAERIMQLTDTQLENDGARLALAIYREQRHRMYEAVMESSQGPRIREFGLQDDLRFGLRTAYTRVVPAWRDGFLLPSFA